MAQDTPYTDIIVESFCPTLTTGLHGSVHVRPAKYQMFAQTYMVGCSKKLSDTTLFPVGTKFRLKVKFTDRQGGGEYLYSYHGWPCVVVPEKEFEKIYKSKRVVKRSRING